MPPPLLSLPRPIARHFFLAHPPKLPHTVLGFAGKRRKRHSETTEPSGKSGIRERPAGKAVAFSPGPSAAVATYQRGECRRCCVRKRGLWPDSPAPKTAG